MPIRTASLSRRIERAGAALHRAMLIRVHSHGEEHEPSEAERALAEERRMLKEEQQRRQAAPRLHTTAADRLVRTHHPEAKDKPKAVKEHKDAKPAKKAAKPHQTRSEKHAAKAAALDAAKRAAKKSAKT